MRQIKRYLIGSYTETLLLGTGETVHGTGAGISLLELDAETGQPLSLRALAQVPNPSWVTRSGDRYVYCVNELKEYGGKGQGSVSVLEWDEKKERLNLRQVLPTRGEDPCHIALSPDGGWAAVSNYGGGSLCLYAVRGDGSLREAGFVQHRGHGADPARQEGPHAHSCIWLGKDTFLAMDLGLDRLFAYRADANGLRILGETAVRAGVGPRHAAFGRDRNVLYVTGEMGSAVLVFGYEAISGRLLLRQEISTLPEDFAGKNTAADLHLSPDGRYLYASNRGHDSLAVFAVSEEDGTLTPAGHYPCGGRTPRHFCIDEGGRYVLAANQDSDSLAILGRDGVTGALRRIAEVRTGMPVCVCPC